MENSIVSLRQKHGLTQQGLAQKVQVTRQTIISLEKGKYDPSIGLAHKIARVFGLRIEDVFIFEEDN
ncbi:helix-turn-helix transcriptional regulator [Atopobium minutum]|uniref:helix-turn-helix transcriptional regulator n=1 Tax=Atopobium minutum TaxID=1381 RepID=UPI00280B663C|nr:helix-turn-helix transcriptional regulator [Atopobium minutum]